jgi:hypothetical protein
LGRTLLLAGKREALGLVGLAVLVQGPAELDRDRRPEAVLAEPAEPVVGGAELLGRPLAVAG